MSILPFGNEEQYAQPDPAAIMAGQMAAQEQMMPSSTVMDAAKQNAEFLRYTLEPEEVLQRIEYQLKGLVYRVGKDGVGRWQDGGKRLVSDEFLRMLMTKLGAFCHKGIITSIYDEADIRQRLMECGQTIIDVLYLNWENGSYKTAKVKLADGTESTKSVWEPSFDHNDVYLIYDLIIFGQIEPTYHRAMNGNTLRMIGQTQKHIVSVTDTHQNKGTGIFGMGFGGR